jgi:hypothetical protein
MIRRMIAHSLLCGGLLMAQDVGKCLPPSSHVVFIGNVVKPLYDCYTTYPERIVCSSRREIVASQIEKIEKVPGVERVHRTRYSISVYIGDLFTQAEVIVGILEVLKCGK